MEEYKFKWGGEDWDLLDRVLMLPVEVERIKHPGLYHHFHSRNRGWKLKKETCTYFRFCNKFGDLSFCCPPCSTNCSSHFILF